MLQNNSQTIPAKPNGKKYTTILSFNYEMILSKRYINIANFIGIKKFLNISKPLLLVD